MALRATLKKQKEHYDEFLRLSEKYANKYLRDIATEIQRQGSLLENLEERLEAAKKLHGEAVNLQMFYESGTVTAMKGFRALGKVVPCCLQSQILRHFDFQEFYDHFHRIIPCSARWTSCWLRFGNFTRN